MAYFDEIMVLPTVKVIQHIYSPQQISAGLLAKLKSTTDDTASIIVYAPDLGYELRGTGMEDSTDYLTLDVPACAIQVITAATTLDQFVINSMLEYPSIFPSREDVLAHTFLVLGNAMEWNKDGVLSDRTVRAKKGPVVRKRMSYEGITMADWSMKDFYKRLDEKSSEDYSQYMLDQFAKHVERATAENAVRRRRELFIEYFATTASKWNVRVSHYEHPNNIVGYVESGFLPIANIPTNADRSFIDGAVEILNKVIASTEGSYLYRPHLNPPADPTKPSWMTEQKEAEPLNEDAKKRIRSSCRYIDNLIIAMKEKRAKTGWSFVTVAQNALTAAGFKKKTVLDASNGTGWTGTYAPCALDEDGFALIERRLTRKGFVKNGLAWSRADWHVSLKLVPVGDKFRAQILIITHPEDSQARIDAMYQSFENGWVQHLRWEAATAMSQHLEIYGDENKAKVAGMDEEALIAFTTKYPPKKERY